MPDSAGPPSEFGGKIQRNGIQPPPHVPTPNERMALLYQTGDESGLTDKDDGSNFSGLRQLEVQTAKREAEGVLVKGQVWEEMQQAGIVAQQELKAQQTPDS